MTRPVEAITAYIAIGKDGAMDLDLVRRSRPAAQWAATSIHGRAWPQLAAVGWRIEAVTVRLASDVVDDPAAARPAPARLGPARDDRPDSPDETPPPARRLRPAPAYVIAGRMKLLRAGEV